MLNELISGIDDSYKFIQYYYVKFINHLFPKKEIDIDRKLEIRKSLCNCDCIFVTENFIDEYFFKHGIKEFSNTEFYEALSEVDKKEFKKQYILHNTKCGNVDIDVAKESFKEKFLKGN